MILCGSLKCMRSVLEPGWHVAVIELVDENNVPMDVNANVEITGITVR